MSSINVKTGATLPSPQKGAGEPSSLILYYFPFTPKTLFEFCLIAKGLTGIRVLPSFTASSTYPILGPLLILFPWTVRTGYAGGRGGKRASVEDPLMLRTAKMYFYVSLLHLLGLLSVVSYSTKANEILIKACKGSWSLLPLKFAFLKQSKTSCLTDVGNLKNSEQEEHLAPSGEHATLDGGAMTLSPVLGVDST